MYKLNIIDKIAFILVIIGALNWGILGLTDVNLVHVIFGTIAPILERIIYILVGVAAIDIIALLIKTKSKNK